MEKTPPPETKKRIEKLRKEIARHRYLYHVLDRQEISDSALDSLKHELQKLEEKYPKLITPDSPTQRVAGRPLPGFKKIKHAVRMISLNDAFSESEAREWEQRIKRAAPGIKFDYFAEIKIDGFAISLIYESGILKTGATRGDGIIGEDVTQNLKTIESIPLHLQNPEDIEHIPEVNEIIKKFPRVKKIVSKIPKYLEIRGEVYMSTHTFEKINREQKSKNLPEFANPRNIAAGSVRQLNPEITAQRRLDFLAYDIIGDLGQQTHEEEHLIAQIFGFKTATHTKYCKNIEEVIGFWKKINKTRERIPFLIDGVVIQVNSGNTFERLGIAGKAPRGAIAFKFAAKEATTTVEDIIVQAGRTGVLTPVAVLKPVTVGGVTVSRATLHNMDEIERLDIRIRDTAIIRRAGDVIPDVVRILKNLRPNHAKKFSMPKYFCGQQVLQKTGEVAHRIPHPEQCDAVIRERFYHFVSRGALNIKGLGPKIINRLLEEGLVQSPADLFRLNEGDLAVLARFGEKSAKNIIQAIHAKKKIDLAKFVFALGIPHVGEETAIDLTKHFGTLKKLVSVAHAELDTIANIGPALSESIYQWFHSPQNHAFLKKLEEMGVTPLSYIPSSEEIKFKGLTFVITGALQSLTRNEAKEKIRVRGGTVSESVSKKTDYVIAGDNPGTKLKKAENLKIKIINENELMNLLS